MLSNPAESLQCLVSFGNQREMFFFDLRSENQTEEDPSPVHAHGGRTSGSIWVRRDVPEDAWLTHADAEVQPKKTKILRPVSSPGRFPTRSVSSRLVSK
jgi:hypothetical protein